MTVTVRKATAGRTTHDQHRTLIILRVVMVAAVVLTVIGLVIVERIGAAYRDALDVAEDAAAVAAAATDPATGLTTDLAALTRSVDDTLQAVGSLAETAAISTGQLGEAAQTNLADSVEGTAQIADRVADVIEGIERFIPGNSDSLAEELRTVSDGLEPVPEQLRTLGDQLIEGSDDLEASLVTLDALSRRIEVIASGIEDTAGAIENLPAVARALEVSAREARDRVTVDLWLFRIAVVLAGAAVFLVALALERMLPASAWRPHDTPHDTPHGQPPGPPHGPPRDASRDSPPAPSLPVEHDLPGRPH
jgi:methyl-accepting chemotaxis protein